MPVPAPVPEPALGGSTDSWRRGVAGTSPHSSAGTASSLSGWAVVVDGRPDQKGPTSPVPTRLSYLAASTLFRCHFDLVGPNRTFRRPRSIARPTLDRNGLCHSLFLIDGICCLFFCAGRFIVRTVLRINVVESREEQPDPAPAKLSRCRGTLSPQCGFTMNARSVSVRTAGSSPPHDLLARRYRKPGAVLRYKPKSSGMVTTAARYCPAVALPRAEDLAPSAP